MKQLFKVQIADTLKNSPKWPLYLEYRAVLVSAYRRPMNDHEICDDQATTAVSPCFCIVPTLCSPLSRADPQSFLEYMHLAHVFLTPRRFMAAVRASFEECYNIVSTEELHAGGKKSARAHHDVRSSLRGSRVKHPPQCGIPNYYKYPNRQLWYRWRYPHDAMEAFSYVHAHTTYCSPYFP